MLNWFASLPVWVQALIGTSFTYAVTAMGAACVYFFKKENKKVLSCMQGIAAGVMLAASFYSLLQPAAEQLDGNKNTWWILGLSFLIGGLFICLTDLFFLIGKKKKKNSANLLSQTTINSTLKNREQTGVNLQQNNPNRKNSAKHTFLAMTLHNIPEGFAVGVAFGSLTGNAGMAALMSAIMLTVGIGIQNFPEGMCVSLCARREGTSLNKSFFLGQFSGLVEVFAGLIGVFAVTVITAILPWALAFSAGAMVAVACVELLPEAVETGKKLATFSVVFGFVLMMVLDIAL